VFPDIRVRLLTAADESSEAVQRRSREAIVMLANQVSWLLYSRGESD
jgi:hypothetical protein